ncbi:MAG: hypothetical protein U0517_04035 [Candidatus Andersenbacteria bacterium]
MVQSHSKTPQIWFLAAVALLVVFVLGFVVRVAAKGQLGELAQFLIDRREGAGQTQPDRGATCLYDLDGQTLVVQRKAHGETETHRLELADRPLSAHFAGQQALVETARSADTYNCINAEFLSHAISGDPADPIRVVLLSSTGRNAAIVVQGDAGEQVEVFSFKANPGESTWNANLKPIQQDPDQAQPILAQLVGESLLVAVQVGDEVEIHTYNFRASHKKRPWNEFSLEQTPLRLSGLRGAPVFSDRGKKVALTTTEPVGTVHYSFEFTCQQNPKPNDPKAKPCVWQREVSPAQVQ